MKINEIILSSIKRLKDKNIDDLNLKIKMILMNILNVSKEYLIIHDNDEFPENKKEEFEQKLKRLEKNEPIQYILNKQEFFGVDFYVDENVLIPQPDTEILVEECIKICQDEENNPQRKKEPLKILDLCTGSGAIGVILAKKIEKSEVFASDISEKALEVSKKNAIKNNVKIEFKKSNLFENINGKFYIIVSNPPYIETEVIKNLSEEVKKEPVLALDGGEDGLYFYRRIAEDAKKYLYSGGFLALEIGYNQKKAVEEILIKNSYKNIYSKKDFGNNDRIIIAQI